MGGSQSKPARAKEAEPIGKNNHSKKGLGVCLKWLRTCVASVRPWVQTTVMRNKNNKTQANILSKVNFFHLEKKYIEYFIHPQSQWDVVTKLRNIFGMALERKQNPLRSGMRENITGAQIRELWWFLCIPRRRRLTSLLVSGAPWELHPSGQPWELTTCVGLGLGRLAGCGSLWGKQKGGPCAKEDGWEPHCCVWGFLLRLPDGPDSPGERACQTSHSMLSRVPPQLGCQSKGVSFLWGFRTRN
jgi:hypothetical protein